MALEFVVEAIYVLKTDNVFSTYIASYSRWRLLFPCAGGLGNLFAREDLHWIHDILDHATIAKFDLPLAIAGFVG
jgi:hypothetical protein